MHKEQNILIQNPETKNFLADAFYPETSGRALKTVSR